MNNKELTSREFYDKLVQKAHDYAYSCVIDPEEHLEAIEVIKSDFIEGGMTAYYILKGDK